MGFLKRRFWEKGQHVGRKGFRNGRQRNNRLVLDPLESRILLSTDLFHATAADAHDLPLKMSDVGDVKTIQLFNNADSNAASPLLASQAASDTTGIVKPGSELSGELVVDLNRPFDKPTSFTDSFQGDSVSLTVSGGNNTWKITGEDAGSVGNVGFSRIENLIGAHNRI